MSQNRFIDYQPGDVVIDSTTVRPGINTENLKLATSQVVTAFSGAEPAVERNADGKIVAALPGNRCQHCGKPTFAYDSVVRKYLWDDSDSRGCHCPRHPKGDGSDGGPVLLRTLDERGVLAAEQTATWLQELTGLMKAFLKANGVELPSMTAEKTQAPATARKAS